MKLHDLIIEDPHRLDEINIKQAIAAGALGAATMMPSTSLNTNQPETQRTVQPAVSTQKEKQPQQDIFKSLNAAASKYSVDPQLFSRIVSAARKHAHPDFPRVDDIIAIIGVESSFQPNAVSGLKKDPARGLMQIRPGVWKIPPHELMDIEKNIKYGSKILRKYYERLGDKEAAIQAYNVGITAFRRGKTNERYLQKYKIEKRNIARAQQVEQQPTDKTSNILAAR